MWLRALLASLFVGAISPASAETIEEQVAYLLFQVEDGGRVRRGSVEENVVSHASASPAAYLTHAGPPGRTANDRTKVTYFVERMGGCTFKGVMTLAEGDRAWTKQTTADLGQPLALTTTTPDDPGIRLTGRKPCAFDVRQTEQTGEGIKDESKCEPSYRAPVVLPDMERLRRTLAAVQSACGGTRSP